MESLHSKGSGDGEEDRIPDSNWGCLSHVKCVLTGALCQRLGSVKSFSGVSHLLDTGWFQILNVDEIILRATVDLSEVMVADYMMVFRSDFYLKHGRFPQVPNGSQ